MRGPVASLAMAAVAVAVVAAAGVVILSPARSTA